MDIKVGVRYILASDHLKELGVKVGDVLTLTKIKENDYHVFKSERVSFDIYLFARHVKPYQDYETSNRKKLHDHIKASGHTSSELGEVLGNKWHFSNITKKSRFDKFGDISEKSLSDSEFLVNSIITGFNKKSNDVEAEIDSEFQLSSDEFDFKFDIPESKNTTPDVQYEKTNNHAPKYSSFIELQKLAFAICFIMVILLISILYFVVSK